MPLDTRPSHSLTFAEACEIVSGASRDFASPADAALLLVAAPEQVTGSPLPAGVTLIPHTDHGRAFMRAALRNMGPAGVEYRQAITGVENWLAAHRRRQAIRTPTPFHGSLAQSRALVLNAVARARSAKSALSGGSQ